MNSRVRDNIRSIIEFTVKIYLKDEFSIHSKKC